MVSNIKVVSYNIRGLKNKIIYPNFFSYLANFSIFILTETWISEGNYNQYEKYFKGYNLFWKSAVKNSLVGRSSGGVLVGIQNSLRPYSKVEERHDFLIISIKNSSIEINIVPIYLSFGKWSDEFSKMENFLLNISVKNIVLIGDFNGRTGSMQEIDNLVEFSEKIQGTRHSQDNILNEKGKLCINLFDLFGLIILNGRYKGDFGGSFTYEGNGNSVIDYCVSSLDNIGFISEFLVDNNCMNYSDHIPIIIKLELSFERISESTNLISKVKWNENKKYQYYTSIDSKLLEEDSLEIFDIVKIIKESASKINFKNHNNFKGKIYKEKWFDKQCEYLRMKALNLLKMYRKSNYSQSIKLLLKSTNKEVKRTYSEKKEKYIKQSAEELKYIKTSDKWWDWVKRFKRSNQSSICAVNSSQCALYFEKLLNCPPESILYSCSNFVQNEELDGPYILLELESVLKNLKVNKAPGSDSVPTEFFKYGSPLLKQCTLDAINKWFDSNDLKYENKAIIIPIYKKGDRTSVQNYRGISLTNSVDKIAAGLLYSRLKKYIEANNVLNESQAGFRSGYSTADNIFSLTNIIKIKWNMGIKKVFCFFVDFRSAFDCVDRATLFYKLQNTGLSSKFLNCISKMYNNTLNSVWDGSELSHLFETYTGVKQGCILSPVLFSLFLNDLSESIGGGVIINNIRINVLMYADDIVVLSECPNELQKMINNLYNYTTNWNLKVNLTKSQIMIFNKGGRKYLDYKEWYFGNEKVDIVGSYKYLGVLFKNNLNFNEHIAQRTSIAKFSINDLWSKFVGNAYIDFESKMKFFNAGIRSILCYSSEVFGYIQYDQIEKVQRSFTKRALSLPSKTPNYLLHVECGLQDIFLYTFQTHTKYISKILTEYNDNRFPKQIALAAIGVNIDWWNIWINLGNECNLKWENLYKNIELWNKNIKNMNYFLKNKFFQKSVERARSTQTHGVFDKLLYFNGNGIFRTKLSIDKIKLIIKARASFLKLNYAPWRNSNQKICSVCNLRENEDIIHFLGKCPIYKHLRKHYFSEHFLDEQKVIDVLNGGQGWDNLFKYLKYTTEERNELISEFNF